jgi:hypothetical protein
VQRYGLAELLADDFSHQCGAMSYRAAGPRLRTDITISDTTCGEGGRSRGILRQFGLRKISALTRGLNVLFLGGAMLLGEFPGMRSLFCCCAAFGILSLLATPTVAAVDEDYRVCTTEPRDPDAVIRACEHLQ